MDDLTALLVEYVRQTNLLATPGNIAYLAASVVLAIGTGTLKF